MRELQRETSMRQYQARAIKVIGCIACLAPIALEAAQGIKLGPATRLETSLEVEYLNTDNFYNAVQDEVDADGYLIKPEVGIVYAPSTGQYSLKYLGEVGEFDTSSEDDYFDNNLIMDASWQPLSRHAFDIQLQYREDHDDFGTVRTAGQNRIDDRPLDEWEEPSAEIKYTFGAESARVNWFLRGIYADRDYTTNEFDPTNPATGTRFLDRQRSGGGTGITYKLSARSKLLAEVELVEIDYDEELPAGSLDGTFEQARIGYRWVAAAKTTGEFWIGGFQREFDDSRREEGSGANWLGKVSWAPKTYSNFTFETGQAVHEAALFGESFIDRQHVSLTWDHFWSTRFHTLAGYKIINDDYEGISRDDDIGELWLAGTYELSKNYSVTLLLNDLERDSSQSIFDFNRTDLILSFNAVF